MNKINQLNKHFLILLSTVTLFELLKIIVSIIQKYAFYPNIQIIFSLFNIFVVILLLGIECYNTQLRKIKNNDIYLQYFQNLVLSLKENESINNKTYQYAFKKMLCLFGFYLYINSLLMLFIYNCCTKYFLTSYQGNFHYHIFIFIILILAGTVLYIFLSLFINKKYYLKEIEGKSLTYLYMTYHLLQCRGNYVLIDCQSLLNSVVVLIRNNAYEEAFHFLNLWRKYNQNIPETYQLIYNYDMCIITLVAKHTDLFLQYYQDYQNVLNSKPKLKGKPLIQQTSTVVSICYYFYNCDYQKCIETCKQYIDMYHTEPDFITYFMYIAFLNTHEEAANQFKESHPDNPLIINKNS